MSPRQQLLLGQPERSPITELGALFSPCRTWRYRLWRAWGPGERLRVVGLNPSTADEERDDHTMRRVEHYARRWGYDGYEMLNLFAARTPYPAEMMARQRAGLDVVGPGNDAALREQAELALVVLCAWGRLGAPYMRERGEVVLEILRASGAALFTLGHNADGSPRHPARLANEIDPYPWNP